MEALDAARTSTDKFKNVLHTDDERKPSTILTFPLRAPKLKLNTATLPYAEHVLAQLRRMLASRGSRLELVLAIVQGRLTQVGWVCLL